MTRRCLLLVRIKSTLLAFWWVFIDATCPSSIPTLASAIVLPSHGTSVFLGKRVTTSFFFQTKATTRKRFSTRCELVMRKQKASDKRTRRQQLGGNEENAEDKFRALTQSPMQQRGQWNDKGKVPVVSSSRTPTSGGRGRSRKRSTLYSTLSFYHDKFLTLLTHEYKSEVIIRFQTI